MLVVAVRYDGTAAGQEWNLPAGIPNPELVLFEQSPHYPFAEEHGRLLSTLDDFLTRVEDRTGP